MSRKLSDEELHAIADMPRDGGADVIFGWMLEDGSVYGLCADPKSRRRQATRKQAGRDRADVPRAPAVSTGGGPVKTVVHRIP